MVMWHVMPHPANTNWCIVRVQHGMQYQGCPRENNSSNGPKTTREYIPDSKQYLHGIFGKASHWNLFMVLCADNVQILARIQQGNSVLCYLCPWRVAAFPKNRVAITLSRVISNINAHLDDRQFMQVLETKSLPTFNTVFVNTLDDCFISIIVSCLATSMGSPIISFPFLVSVSIFRMNARLSRSLSPAI